MCITMEETIKCKCEKCGADYEKPATFKTWYDENPKMIFFKWSLAFCDDCRREKELESLKNLPNIISALSEKLN